MGARDVVFTILAIDEASHTFDKIGRKAEETGSKFGPLGKAAGVALGALAVGAAAAAVEGVKMASEFQTSLSLLATGAGESRANLDTVGKGILGMAGNVGIGANELVKAMYLVESAGYHGAAGLKVLQAAAEGAKTDGADVTEVGNALTTVLNDMHAPAASAATVMSQMVAAVGQGKMRMNDLAGAIHSVLPNASSLGLSFAQTAGALATMTAQGIGADQAAQNLNHTIVKLAAPTRAMTSAMARYGLSAQDVAKNLGKEGLTGTLDEIVKAITSHMGPAGVTLINTFNQSKAAAQDAAIAMKALPPAARDLAQSYAQGKVSLGDFRKEVKALPADQAALVMQWKAMEDGSHGFSDSLKSGKPAAQTFTAALKDMLGDQTALQVALHLTGAHAAEFSAAVKKIAGTTADAGGHVKDFAETQKNLSAQWADARASLNTLLIELGAKLIPILTKAIKVVNDNKAAVAALLGVLAGIGATVAVVKAVTAAWEAMKAVAIAYQAVSTAAWWAVQKAALIAYSVAQKAVNVATVAWKELQFWSVIAQAAAQWVIAAAKAVAYKVVQLAVTVATKAWAAAQWLLNVAMDANPIGIVAVAIAALAVGIIYAYKRSETFRNVVNSVWAVVEGSVLAAVNNIKVAWSAMVHAGAVVINWFKALPGKILGFLQGLPGKMLQVGKDIVMGIVHGIQGAAGAAWDAIKGVASGIMNGIKGFMGISSPAKKMVPIGRSIIDGVIVGLKQTMPAAYAEMKSFALRIADIKVSHALKASISKIADHIGSQMVLTTTKVQDLTKKIDAQKQAVADLFKKRAEYAQQLAQGISGGGITSIGLTTTATDAEGNTTNLTPQQQAAAFLDSMKARVRAIHDFANNMDALRSKGLSADILQQIAQSGLDTGGALASALATATPQTIAGVNGMAAQIKDSSARFGTEWAGDMYNTGINAANGILKGLESKRNDLLAMIREMAQAVTAEINKVLAGGGGGTSIASTTASSAHAAHVAHVATVSRGDTHVHVHMQSGYIGSTDQLATALSDTIQRARSRGLTIRGLQNPV